MSQCLEVEFCAISLVLGEPILREFQMEFGHDAVASDLGDDAGGGDGKGKSVSFDEGRVRNGQAFHGETIHQAVLRRNWQRLHGTAHGEVSGA